MNIAILRAKAHKLSPTVTIGKGGVSETVIEALENELESHELIKVAINIDDRSLRRDYTEQCVHSTGATLIQKIGKRIVLYRKRTEPTAKVP